MTIRQSRRILISGIFAFFVVLVIFYFQNQLAPMIAEGQQGASSKSLSGYAWSSNIGWIGFKGSGPNYGVTLSSDNEKFQGYAWSSNIGWINFDPVIDSSGTGDALPTGATDTYGAKLGSGGQITGWVRACSVFSSGCNGDLKGPSYLGGWDGWIKMNPTGNVNDDVHLTSSNQLEGYAWGSDVVGWIDFCGTASGNGDYCVTVDSLDVNCTVTDDNGDGRFDVGEDVTWAALVTSGGVSPYVYTYCWGANCSSPVLGGDINAGPNSGETDVIIGNYLTAGPVTAQVRAAQTEGGGRNGEATCAIEVQSPMTPKLTVQVSGGSYGAVYANPSGSEPVPGTPPWTNAGCRINNCSSTYLADDQVILTATEDKTASGGTCEDQETGNPADCVFEGWTGACSGSAPSCVVDMGTEAKFVGATFKNPGIVLDTITLNVDPPGLEINSHNEGLPAETVRATITATGGDLSNAELCVGSFDSAISGQSIDAIISNSNDKLQCRLGGRDGDNIKNCATDERHCVFFKDDSGTYKATFQISVPTKLTSIPKTYLVKLFVQGEGLTGDVTMPFIYRPSGGGP